MEANALALPAANSGPRRKRWWRKYTPYWQEYLFISPFFILFAIFFAYPLVWALILSFQRWDGVTEARWVGLDNYRFILKDPLTQQTFYNAFRFLLILVPLGMIMPLFFGVLLNTAALKFRSGFRTIIFLPTVTSMVGVGIVWKLLFSGRNGWLNGILDRFGLGPYNWLGDEWLAQVPIVTLTVWGSLGFATLVVLGGLQAIDLDIYDAAKIDGASSWNVFWKITLPLMRPVMIFMLITSSIGVMNIFSQVYIVTQGGPANETMTPLMYIYRVGIGSAGGARIGDASAMSFLLSLVTLVIVMIQFTIVRRRERD